MEGIRAASVYAEADFRIKANAFDNINKFEERLDKLKVKLDSLHSGKIGTGVGSGGGRSVGGGSGGARGGRQGEGWYWNTIGKVAYNMRKREAMVESALTGMQNTFRTLKLPQKEMDRLTNSVKEYGEKLKSGEMISAEFAVQLKKIKSEARDLHKTLNVPPPKYSTGINKGLGLAMTPMIKAKYKQEGLIETKESQLHRTLQELKIDLQSKRGQEALARFKGISDVFRDAPHDVNTFRKSLAALDLDLRKVGRGGVAGFMDSMRSVKTGLVVLAGTAMAGFAAQAENIGVQFNSMNIMFQTAFGETAKNELKFVRQEADALGVSFLEASRSWTKLGFSAKIGGFSIDDARGLFTSMIGFSKAMGLSTEQMALSFQAIIQAYAKGALTAEELNTQLADHIPGIIAMMQQALGFQGNGEGFSKALRNKEFTPEKFAKALSTVLNKQAGNFRESEFFGYGQKKGQLTNQFFENMNSFFKGMEPRLMLLFDNLSFLLKVTMPLWRGVGIMLAEAITGITTGVRFVVAILHDMFYYMMGDEKVRKDLNEYFGMKTPTKQEAAVGMLKRLMPVQATAAGLIYDTGNAIADSISKALKGNIKIEILPSPEFVAKTTGNSIWLPLNVATP